MKLLMIEMYQEDCSNIAVSERIKDMEVRIVNAREKDGYTQINAIFSGDVLKENIIDVLKRERAFNINLRMRSKEEMQVSYDIVTTTAWNTITSLGGVIIPPLKISDGVLRGGWCSSRKKSQTISSRDI